MSAVPLSCVLMCLCFILSFSDLMSDIRQFMVSPGRPQLPARNRRVVDSDESDDQQRQVRPRDNPPVIVHPVVNVDDSSDDMCVQRPQGVGVEDDFFIVAVVRGVAVAVEVGQVLIYVGKGRRSRSYGLPRAVWCS